MSPECHVPHKIGDACVDPRSVATPIPDARARLRIETYVPIDTVHASPPGHTV